LPSETPPRPLGETKKEKKSFGRIDCMEKKDSFLKGKLRPGTGKKVYSHQETGKAITKKKTEKKKKPRPSGGETAGVILRGLLRMGKKMIRREEAHQKRKGVSSGRRGFAQKTTKIAGAGQPAPAY